MLKKLWDKSFSSCECDKWMGELIKYKTKKYYSGLVLKLASDDYICLHCKRVIEKSVKRGFCFTYEPGE